jgi:hypothetical protein
MARRPMNLSIRKADDADLSEVLAILAESSAWLKTKGIIQWPDRFPEAPILRTIQRGEVFVATESETPVATVTLQWRDPSFWGGRDDAAFIHRLAVRRSHAGAGSLVLDWASKQVLSHDRSFICLDCLSTNLRLRRYYEELGFQQVGEVSGPSDHPHSRAHGSWQAILYEKHIPKS